MQGTLCYKVVAMAEDFFENWVVQVRKGILELWILNLLKGNECYGYDLVKQLTARTGGGVTEGTLYPLLSRLHVQGLVDTRLKESQNGPARKYYTLTREGKKVAELMNKHLELLLAETRALQHKEKSNE